MIICERENKNLKSGFRVQCNCMYVRIVVDLDDPIQLGEKAREKTKVVKRKKYFEKLTMDDQFHYLNRFKIGLNQKIKTKKMSEARYLE